MDPDVTLDELRSLVDGDNSGLPAAQRVEEMCELFTALDDWLSRNGFLPKAWARKD